MYGNVKSGIRKYAIELKPHIEVIYTAYYSNLNQKGREVKRREEKRSE